MDNEEKTEEESGTEESETKKEDEQVDELAEKIAAVTLKKVMNKLENELDKTSEFNKDVKLGKAYVGGFTREQVEKMAWQEKAALFVKSVINGDRQGALELGGSKTKAQPLVEGTNALGGYLVPEEWAPEIGRRVEEMTVVRPRATVYRTTRDVLHVPTEDTQPKATWRSESAVKSTTTAQFNEVNLTPYSLAAILIVSEELMSDNAYSLMDILTASLARKFALTEDEAFLVGSGSGRPTGIDNYTALFTRDAGGAFSGTTAGDYIIEAYHKLNPFYRANAVWIMHPTVATIVRQIKNSQGQYLVQDLAGSPTPTLMGRPVVESSFMDQSKIFFIDLRQYYIADRQEFRIDVSNQATVASRSMFERNEIAIRAEERVDGELAYTQAFAEINNLV